MSPEALEAVVNQFRALREVWPTFIIALIISVYVAYRLIHWVLESKYGGKISGLEQQTAGLQDELKRAAAQRETKRAEENTEGLWERAAQQADNPDVDALLHATQRQFRQLNATLGCSAIAVLYWIGRNSDASAGKFHEAWRDVIPLVEERDELLRTLRVCELIDTREEQLKITAKGRFYLVEQEVAMLAEVEALQPRGVDSASATPDEKVDQK